MRTKNSILNTLIVLLLNFVTIVVGIVAQRIFISILGIEYLGLNGLFSNILSVLAIVELGLGSAIVYHLYRPVAENNKEKIKSLMRFYKIGYRIVAIVVLALGISILPFLPKIIGETNINENLSYLYLLYLGDVVVSYLLTYKRSILYANQKTYIINTVHIAYLVLMNMAQLIMLYITKDYSLYLWVKIIFRVLENLVITYIANREYPFLREKDVKRVDAHTKKDIITKIKGLLYHKVGTFVVLGTDNIIISVFLGIECVGLYNNYYLIISKVQSLFSQIFTSITASVGNLLIEKNKNKSYLMYKNILLINSWIFMAVSSVILCTFQPFVELWVGKEYVLPFEVLVVLVINLYMQGLRMTSLTFKNAAGVFYEDRMMPIAEAIINIIASVILVQYLGLAGVFLGTIASTILLYVYGYYKYVYKRLFERSYSQYLKDYLVVYFSTIVAVTVSFVVTMNIEVNNLLLQIILRLILSFICCNVVYLMFFCKTAEFKYLVDLFKKILRKIGRKIRRASRRAKR